MTQEIALIVHQLMDEPDKWLEKGDFITNGYYNVWLNGARYGMGAASYNASGAERDMLNRALDAWKIDTGWIAKAVDKIAAESAAKRIYVAPDTYIRQNYEEFARLVRGAHRSFVVHGDANVFGIHVQQALTKLDSSLHPLTRGEEKRNAEES